MDDVLRSRLGLTEFRAGQRSVCESITQGHDALLVMPTGAGKSLCYQLPTLVRGGTALVISPLVALIEDQVKKLHSLGLKAERIHSGRPREESREAFKRYLRHELEFLFIAPERLAVPGFSDWLAKSPPTLIAVDEAHCISQWGHDFRPDYRLVGERLGKFRQAPIIALTATATPDVQDDITAQLGLRNPKRFIQGFRRTNLAIETLELNPSERPDEIQKILMPPERRPAILYAPTRKRAEEIASLIRGGLKAEAYHAGMTSEKRDKIQNRFIIGKTDIIVATVAFGMGIDKSNVRTVIHCALPATIEGYYQEIGRAGRDGELARAVLLHSGIDKKMHEHFLERDYPSIETLRRVKQAVGAQPISLDSLKDRLNRINQEEMEKALEKLRALGVVSMTIGSDHGARVSLKLSSSHPPTTNESQAANAHSSGWERSYSDQTKHRTKALKLMSQFTSDERCRMVSLITHFGEEDSKEPCGLCDRCVPNQSLTKSKLRELKEGELLWATSILTVLSGQDGIAAGRLFDEACSLLREKGKPKTRTLFEKILKALEKSDFVESQNLEFEKDGKTIGFRKILLTPNGQSARAEDLQSLQIPEHATAPTATRRTVYRQVRSRKGRTHREVRHD